MNGSLLNLKVKTPSILLLLLIVQCYMVQPAQSDQVKAVVFVCGSAITHEDIALKVSVEHAYENKQASKASAFVSLVNDAIEQEIARINGVVVTQKEIDAFKRRIEQGTRAPEILVRVKGLFAKSPEAYDRIYITPKILNRKLHDYYNQSRIIHKSEASRIESAHKSVLRGTPFKGVADQTGLEYAAFEINKRAAIMPSSTSAIIRKHKNSQQSPILMLLEGLSVGETATTVVEDSYCYRIMRLIGKKDSILFVEAITLKKKPFDKWFQQHASKISITIHDHELYGSMKRRYPDIWWHTIIADKR